MVMAQFLHVPFPHRIVEELLTTGNLTQVCLRTSEALEAAYTEQNGPTLNFQLGRSLAGHRKTGQCIQMLLQIPL